MRHLIAANSEGHLQNPNPPDLKAQACIESRNLALDLAKMEARGFRANPRRTSMRSLRMSTADWVYSSGFVLILACILFLSF